VFGVNRSCESEAVTGNTLAEAFRHASGDLMVRVWERKVSVTPASLRFDSQPCRKHHQRGPQRVGGQ